eukprot:774823-Pyramimonas_sp.AAC.1
MGGGVAGGTGGWGGGAASHLKIVPDSPAKRIGSMLGPVVTLSRVLPLSSSFVLHDMPGERYNPVKRAGPQEDGALPFWHICFVSPLHRLACCDGRSVQGPPWEWRVWRPLGLHTDSMASVQNWRENCFLQ